MSDNPGGCFSWFNGKYKCLASKEQPASKDSMFWFKGNGYKYEVQSTKSKKMKGSCTVLDAILESKEMVTAMMQENSSPESSDPSNYLVWISDPQIRKGVMMVNDDSILRKLPTKVVNDILCKCQTYIENIDPREKLESKSQQVQLLYQFTESKFNEYQEYMELKREHIHKLRIFIENYMIAQIYDLMGWRECSDSYEFRVFERQLSQVRNFFSSNKLTLADKEQYFLELTTMNLKSITLDKFPTWKFWCLNQWGKNVETLADSHLPNLTIKDGKKILISLHCLIKMESFNLPKELQFSKMFGHPFRQRDAQIVCILNILSCALGAMSVLASYSKPMDEINLTMLLDTACKTTQKSQKNGIMVKRDEENFRETLTLLLYRPRGWKTKLGKLERIRRTVWQRRQVLN